MSDVDGPLGSARQHLPFPTMCASQDERFHIKTIDAQWNPQAVVAETGHSLHMWRKEFKLLFEYYIEVGYKFREKHIIRLMFDMRTLVGVLLLILSLLVQRD